MVMNDFQIAIESERKAFFNALIELHLTNKTRRDDILSDRLFLFIQNLYPLLRSQIFPKKGYLYLAESLYRTALKNESTVHLRVVLASPTAVAEIGHFLQCANIFRKHGFKLDLKLLLVRWENLIDARNKKASFRQMVFEQQIQDVRYIIVEENFSEAELIPVNVEVDCDSGALLGPQDFCECFDQVLRASHNPDDADSTLLRDLLWSTNFYGRQASLSRLGKEQVLIDLAIRRAIGRRFYTEYSFLEQKESKVFAMLTSELNKSLLRCYNSTIPTINIDVKAPINLQRQQLSNSFIPTTVSLRS